MTDKPLLKFSIFLFCLAIVSIVADFLIIFYMASRCDITRSPFYCDFNAFGFASIILAIPGLILFVIAVISFLVQFFYKGQISHSIKVTGIVFCTIIFIAPYTLWIFANPKTYSDWQAIRAQDLNALQAQQRQNCLNYKDVILNRKATDPMPTPPPNCN